MFRSHSSRRMQRLATAIAVVAAGACGSFHHTPIDNQGPALVIFTNESLDQADVYAISPGGGARRIGTVFAGRSDTLVVPADLTVPRGPVTIVARLMTRSRAPSTGPVSMYPGELYLVGLRNDEKILSVVNGQ